MLTTIETFDPAANLVTGPTALQVKSLISAHKQQHNDLSILLIV